MVGKKKKFKRCIAFFIMFMILFLFACDSKEDENTSNSKDTYGNEEEIYDIYLLFKAPVAEEQKDFSDVIKIVLNENDSSVSKTAAIEIDQGLVHAKPWTSSSGILSEGKYEDVEDLDEFIELLKEYQVDNWEEDYTFEAPETFEDGYGWGLWLQYEDGTVEKHSGSGSFKDEVTPERFAEFSRDLHQLVAEKTEGKEITGE